MSASVPANPLRPTREPQVEPLHRSRFSRLAAKELREVLRDRRTIITLLLMPALVYPLLSIAFQQLLLSSGTNQGPIVYRIGVVAEEDALRLHELLRAGDAIFQANQPAAPVPEEKSDGIISKMLPQPNMVQPNVDNIRVQWPDQIDAQLESGHLDLVVRFVPRSQLPANPGEAGVDSNRHLDFDEFDIELAYRPTMEFGRALALFVERRLTAVKEQWLLARLARHGDPIPAPISIHHKSITSQQRDPFSIAALIPLVLVLMTITGAVYPAIDVTAGERERGTLESLMAAPVSRMRLLAAKYVAVVTVAVLTAMANVGAMLLTLYSTGLGRVLLGDTGFSPATLSQVFLLLILFAAFFAAVLLTLTSFARSFKEAQAYLIPLMLVALGPGFLSLMPDVRLNLGWAVTPLANLVLLARDILQGNAERSVALVAILTTLMYGVGAISLAARVFGGDAILYGAAGSWTEFMKRSSVERPAPSLDAAAITIALLFPLYFVVGGVLGQLRGWSIAGIEAFRSANLAWLFIGLPALVAWRQRVNLSRAFQIRRVSWMAFAGAGILGVSLWPIAYELFLLGRKLGIDPLNERLVEHVGQLIQQWRQLSPFVILLTMAVAPAICEELFFRGFLLSALRGRVPAWTAIAISALVFGLFHAFVGATLTLQRLMPTTFLGLAMAIVCWRTGSVLPGMLLHCLNNGLLLMLAYYRDQLTAQVFGSGNAERPPILWLAASAVGVLIGLVLVFRCRSDQPPADQATSARAATEGSP